ncbi:MAG: hypothetical protein IKE16_08815, partial [Solobacterium sp.]|nr:hypothetical protein [Solobacterium sp.]
PDRTDGISPLFHSFYFHSFFHSLLFFQQGGCTRRRFCHEDDSVLFYPTIAGILSQNEQFTEEAPHQDETKQRFAGKSLFAVPVSAFHFITTGKQQFSLPRECGKENCC